MKPSEFGATFETSFLGGSFSMMLFQKQEMDRNYRSSVQEQQSFSEQQDTETNYTSIC
jgi:hypothetical protein